MRNASEGLTRIEIVVLIAALVFFGVFIILPMVQYYSAAPASGDGCRSNLGQIVKACITYQEPNGDFFPVYWDGDSLDPMMSLALLYPDYIDSPKYFGCSKTEDRPVTTVKRVNGAEVKSFGPVSCKERCSYFYDPTSHLLDVGPGQAIAADADGTAWRTPRGTRPGYPENWQRKPRKPNHASGQNVMYFDGHVRWTETNYESDEPLGSGGSAGSGGQYIYLFLPSLLRARFAARGGTRNRLAVSAHVL